MATCPKCGKRLAAWGNCLNCGYKDGETFTEEEKKQAEEKVKKSDESAKSILFVLFLLIVAAVIYLFATSTLQINVTGTITVQ